MPRNKNHIKAIPAPILNYSGNSVRFPKQKIPILKKHQYIVKSERISGDAPKDLIYVYEFGRSKKIHKKTWVKYIAKVGHKWFPSESISEQILTRFGQEWGFNMANSKLYIVAGQLRFCSEFFRKNDQELVHGADILARYLQESDASIIEQIDKNGWSQELLTLTFVKNAIKSVFPIEANELISELIKMLLFDAIVGNNDRHFFNWGILRDLKGVKKPIFSPIYDTARGLFWNHSEEKLLSLHKNEKLLSNFIVKYHNNTKPKIGWENEKNISHFQMVERLLIDNDCTFDQANKLFSDQNLKKAESILNNEFDGLISPVRKAVILRYLTYRFEAFVNLSST